MESNVFRFDASQCRRLSTLGLIPAQIAALEIHALRAIALHSQPRRLSEARLTLERLRADASRLLNALKSMEPARIPAELDSARLLLLMAHYGGEGELPSASPITETLLVQLERFVETAERAWADSYRIKERKHSASPEPIRLIVRVMEETSGFEGRESLIGDLPWSVIITRAWLLEVACICYGAAGRENTDPERAVRTYLQQEAQRRSELAVHMARFAEKHQKCEK